MEDTVNQNTDKKKVIREFGLSSLAVNNRTSIFLLTAIIAMLGVWSYISIPKESFPDIVIPTIIVNTVYPGNSPVDIENLITRPIEKEIKPITGIKNITSSSVQDYSIIAVEFIPEQDVAKALQDVKDAVDKAKRELPTDLDQDPVVSDIDLTELPIMFVNISGNYTISELKSYAEYLQDEFEKLPEISKADIRGAMEREIRIDADIHKMTAMQVSFKDINDAVAAENITMSGGNILANEFRRSLRIQGEFTNTREIEDVIVSDENNRMVYLRDVAEVRDTFAEPKSYSRSSMLPVVTLNIVKRKGENLITTSNKIRDIIAKAKQNRFPENLDITITGDQSKYTKNIVDNLENSIIMGVLLVTLVLMFFMGLRNALFVGIAIPLSMFMGFMILNAIGYSANMIVLFSLILALGMLVDNGIVVVENIYRLMQEGYPPLRAAKEGVGEVALPIITSTATTLAAFLPLAFWTGIMGEFMKYLPITLIIVLSSSLFVALVINPVLTSKYMKLQETRKVNVKRLFIISIIFMAAAIGFYVTRYYAIGNILMLIALFMPFNIHVLIPGVKWFQHRFFPFLEKSYYRTLKYALSGSMPYMVLVGTIALLVISVMLLGWREPKVSLFPDNKPNYVNVFIEKPVGTDIETTNAFTMQVEREILEMMEPYYLAVESIIANVGEGSGDEFSFGGETPNNSKVTVSFVEYEKRNGVDTSELLEMIRAAMAKYPGVAISVDKEQNGPPVGKPINIEVSGEDMEKLIALTDRIRFEIESSNIQGIEELKTDLQLHKPEVQVLVNRERARRFGLSTYTVSDELRTGLYGREVSKFKEGEDDYPINLRLKDEFRYDIDALMNKQITFRDNAGKIKQVPISSVSDLKYSSTYGAINRKNLNRTVNIYSNVMEKYNANEIISELRLLVDGMNIPGEFEVRFTGEQEEQEQSSQFLLSALIIAISMILMIIVAQFNSIVTPFIIMLSVLFSTIGVFLGLVAFNMDFIIIMTGIGIISLAGIVVNNAIVLIDYIDLVRKRKRAELNIPDGKLLPYNEIVESIIRGGEVRLRPVMLTAITTILGLIPLALGMNLNFITLFTEFNPNFYMGGDNAAFWGPMAWTVIFGLTFSTFLTLIVVPSMYLIADKFRNWMSGKRSVSLEEIGRLQ
jgi:multidrug efflux pump